MPVVAHGKPALRSLAHPMLPRPPHPAPTFVTMANAPLSEQDGDDYSGDLRFRKNRIFFRRGIDTLAAKQLDGQISRAARGGIGLLKRTANWTSPRRAGKN